MRRTAPIAFALLVFLGAGVIGERWITLSKESGGSLHNLTLSYNLWRWQIASTRRADPPVLQPDNRREPGYSILLAGVLAATADPDTVTRSCLVTRGPACEATVRTLKRTNAWILAATCAGTFVAARWLFAGLPLGGGPLGVALGSWLAVAACLLFTTTASLWRVIDRAKSETLATLLLLASCAGLHAAVTRRRWLPAAIAGGAALGALMLTKAVFFYVGPLLLAAAWIPVAGRRRLLQIGTLVLVAYALTAPWLARNLAHGFGLGISKDREVLAIRAEHTTMSWREWTASWLYFASEGSGLARAALESRFEPSDWDRLQERNPDGYYLRAKRNQGEVARRAGSPHPSEEATYQAAKSVILENWPMQIALTGPFAVRGIFVGQNLYRHPNLKVLARSLANCLVPALALFVIWLALRRDAGALWFFALPVYSYAFHAGITQNIDRFSWPILPAGAIAFAALAGLAACGLIRRDVCSRA